MLDIIYLALTLALFALITLIAQAIDKMGPHARGSVPRGATNAAANGEERE